MNDDDDEFEDDDDELTKMNTREKLKHFRGHGKQLPLRVPNESIQAARSTRQDTRARTDKRGLVARIARAADRVSMLTQLCRNGPNLPNPRTAVILITNNRCRHGMSRKP